MVEGQLGSSSSNTHSASAGTFPRPRTIELSSGVGLSLGWDVLATDTSDVIRNVLSGNIHANSSNGPEFGVVQVRELDLTVPPCLWSWLDLEIVASHSSFHHDSPQDANASESKSHSTGQELLKPPFD